MIFVILFRIEFYFTNPGLKDVRTCEAMDFLLR